MTETIICECGIIVKGTSEEHAKANLEIHKTSKRHKSRMFDKGQENE